MRTLMLWLFLIATPAIAQEDVPCEGAEAMMRLVGMGVDGMKAFSSACAEDPATDQCMSYNTALLGSAHRLQPGDSEKIRLFETWLKTACPSISFYAG